MKENRRTANNEEEEAKEGGSGGTEGECEPSDNDSNTEVD